MKAVAEAGLTSAGALLLFFLLQPPLPSFFLKFVGGLGRGERGASLDFQR